MGTNGGFNPPSDPACPDPSTRAQLLALRAANGLSEQCHYLVTDGPVIGTTGNTSPTQILMHAVGPGELSSNVHVNTQFGTTDDTSARIYDIALGAAGSIAQLTDDFDNVVRDGDVNAPTVHTQFPWHARGANLRDNNVSDCTLTGWDTAVAAGAVIWDNELLESGIHLTGMTSGSFLRNRIQGSQVTVSSPDTFFTSNDIRNSPVTFAGVSASAQGFQANAVLSGRFEVTSATTGPVTANHNVIGGQGIIGYRTLVDGATAAVSVSGNRLFNQGPHATYDLHITGAGAVTFDSNEVGAGTVDINSPGAVSVTASTLTKHTLTVTAATGVEALRATDGTRSLAL